MITGVTLLSRFPAPGNTTPLHIDSPSSAVVEGQTLDLNCVIASPAQATVTWYKRGGTLPAKHQVGDMERGCHHRGWMWLTNSSGQASVAHAGPAVPVQDQVTCVNADDPMEAQVAPVSPGDPIQNQETPCQPWWSMKG